MKIKEATILIVDDTPQNLIVLSSILKQEGYKICYAKNGEQALQSANADNPDLILLDVMMPVMNGYEACEKLKANPKTMDIPVLFISSLSSYKDKEKAFDAGGVDYVEKPFNAKEVLLRVKTHVTLYKAQRELDRKTRNLTYAEKMAEIGNFSYDTQSNELQFSQGLSDIYEFNGVDLKEDLHTKSLQLIHPEDRNIAVDKLKDLIESGSSGSLEYRIIVPSGHVKTLFTIIGEVAKDKKGKRKILTGVVQDVTNRKQNEEAIKLIADLANDFSEENVNIDNIYKYVLDQFCQLMNWQLGHVCKYNESKGYLEPSGIWNSTENTAFDRFKKITTETNFKSGIGLLGNVLATKKAQWIKDVNLDPDFTRNRNIGQLIVKGVYAFPVIINNNVISVLEFYSEQTLELNDFTLNLINEIGKRFGVLLNQKLLMQEIAATKNRLSNIIEYANAGIAYTTKDGALVSVNLKFSEILAYEKKEDLIGLNISEYTYSADLDKDKDFLEQMKKGEIDTYQIEKRYITKNKKLKWIDLRVSAITDSNGEINNFIAMAVDITAKKEAELILKESEEKFTQALSQKVKERTFELEETKTMLESSLAKEKELGDLKSQFVATASHQFRTPLTVIQSNIELLEMQMEQVDLAFKPKIERISMRIKSETKRMTDLMDDVLILGKVNAGGVEPKYIAIDIGEICDKILTEFNLVQEDGRAAKLSIKGKKRVLKLDPKLFEHAFLNIISNAFKYSSGAPAPVVRIDYINGSTILEIEDFGIGIPEQEIKNFFNPFFRASNVVDIPGTGLGTTIIKEYIEVNNGTISVKSKNGLGTVVKLEF